MKQSTVRYDTKTYGNTVDRLKHCAAMLYQNFNYFSTVLYRSDLQ